MFPDEYKRILLNLVEADEDMKTLLGLFHLLNGYTTEEALVKNVAAITGREKDCREMLKLLRRRKILKLGPYNEYLCLSGYEEFFDDITARYSVQYRRDGDLLKYFETAVESGDEAALRMIYLLLNLEKHGVSELTQYDIIRTEISEMFSHDAFKTIEEKLIKEKLCIYGKKRGKEFLQLCPSPSPNQSEETVNDLRSRLRVWRTAKLAGKSGTVIKTVEKESQELVASARKSIKSLRAQMAEQASMSEDEMDESVGYFSGLTPDASSMFITGNLIIYRDTLHIAITDSLSRYDAREWKYYPVVFITEEVPRWIGKIEIVFKNSYPKLSDRRMAIVVPNKVAYSNFKHNLLLEFVNRLGISEIVQGFRV